jgi:glycosyltransferase involved in cell wall biosynthesis
MNTPIRVIYGPVDETLLPFGDCKRDQAHFVMLGRVLPHKGYEHAINALPKGARLSIIGRRQDKGYFTYLKNYAKGKAVYFESDLDDLGVGRLLASAGLYLHTGTHFGYRGQYFAKPELLGIAPLEAMCTGTPAIVSQAGALPELAKTVGCKTYASETALREMLHTHMVGNLFQATPNEIRADAIKHYGLQQFGKAYLETIAEISAKEKSSAHSLGLELIPA